MYLLVSICIGYKMYLYPLVSTNRTLLYVGYMYPFVSTCIHLYRQV